MKQLEVNEAAKLAGETPQTVEAQECSDAKDIYGFLLSHKLHVRYKQYDDLGNFYWIELPMPSMGKAMSVFVREIVTI